MENRELIRAKNVFVLQMEMQVVDDMGRLEINMTGAGDGMLFQDGILQPIHWKKESPEEWFTFVGLEGNSISFHPGATWIEIVPSLLSS
jgi:hypothetical protein